MPSQAGIALPKSSSGQEHGPEGPTGTPEEPERRGARITRLARVEATGGLCKFAKVPVPGKANPDVAVAPSDLG